MRRAVSPTGKPPIAHALKEKPPSGFPTSGFDCINLSTDHRDKVRVAYPTQLQSFVGKWLGPLVKGLWSDVNLAGPRDRTIIDARQ
jgi:hypothetical protein